MPRVFSRKFKEGRQPPGGIAARITRLETMLYESNAYIVKLVNKNPSGPDGLSDDDVDFLQAAEEFRRSLTAELRSLDMKGVR